PHPRLAAGDRARRRAHGRDQPPAFRGRGAGLPRRLRITVAQADPVSPAATTLATPRISSAVGTGRPSSACGRSAAVTVNTAETQVSAQARSVRGSTGAGALACNTRAVVS